MGVTRMEQLTSEFIEKHKNEYYAFYDYDIKDDFCAIILFSSLEKIIAPALELTHAFTNPDYMDKAYNWLHPDKSKKHFSVTSSYFLLPVDEKTFQEICQTTQLQYDYFKKNQSKAIFLGYIKS